MRTRHDGIVGCLLGGAIGDALGAVYEGAPAPVEIDPELTGILTDDTQLTLATCEAIVASGKVDPEAIAAGFVGWFRAGRINGIGASTYKALADLDAGGHWALVGRKGEMAAGNGAAMRIAPLAFWLDPADHAARRTIRDVSRITHHHDEAYVGALAIVHAVRLAWDGTWTVGTSLLTLVIPLLPDSRVRDRLLELAAIEQRLTLTEIAEQYGNSGYVVESVPLALCAAQRMVSLGFEDTLVQIITAGGDSDTIGSMAGQLAGTLLGESGLPASLIERLPDRAAVLNSARQFADLVRSTMGDE